MHIITASHVVKSFGYGPVLVDADWELGDRDRVGIVGPNGSGKSTFLRLLAREDVVDGGVIAWRRGLTLGYVPQLFQAADTTPVRAVIEGAFQAVMALHDRVAESATEMATTTDARRLTAAGAAYDRALQELLRVDGYSVHSRVEGIIKGLGFDAAVLDLPLSTLSGGERTKVALARALVANPECLILDEPTNHLDLAALEWLEEYLSHYAGAVVVVSHDRYFLDRFATRIWELDSGAMTLHLGNFSYFSAERERRLLAEFEAYKEQQKRIDKMEAAIKRLRHWANQAHPPNEGMHRRAASMQKALDRMVKLERPDQERAAMRLHIESSERSGDVVVRLADVCWSYQEKRVIDRVTWQVREEDKVGIVGANGAGKSTLVKLIAGELLPQAGTVFVGPSVRLGVLTQHIWPADADPHERLIDRFRSVVAMEQGDSRHYLARFLFFGDKVFQPVSSLSGGEQMRLRLAQLMLQNINTLVLDEPTNHLDIESREVLESVLEEFTGTLIVVSHDRYFLNRHVTMVDTLSQGKVVRFAGRYDEMRASQPDARR